MAVRMSAQVASAKTATQTVNFHVLPSTGFWSECVKVWLLGLRREVVIRAIEEEITRERQVADEVVQAMPSAKREKYFSMTTANDDLLQEFAVLQEELDILVTRKEDYEAELSHSQIKQEMVRLHETLSALEGKRDAMEAEHKSLGSPQEQREKLLKQVKPHTEAGFLESFEESKAEELEKLNQSQENIVSLLEHCSRVSNRKTWRERRVVIQH
ncbi:hypothetical protein GOODEAATRI_004492 [Goodea atripinnis]|uniref:Uncharacterized protein n=1 Tax=Goodea atripinnis TaxID=208336 RepID=A0ABV0PL14_9TELE